MPGEVFKGFLQKCTPHIAARDWEAAIDAAEEAIAWCAAQADDAPARFLGRQLLIYVHGEAALDPQLPRETRAFYFKEALIQFRVLQALGKPQFDGQEVAFAARFAGQVPIPDGYLNDVPALAESCLREMGAAALEDAVRLSP
jgi:hypothetical protein